MPSVFLVTSDFRSMCTEAREAIKAIDAGNLSEAASHASNIRRCTRAVEHWHQNSVLTRLAARDPLVMAARDQRDGDAPNEDCGMGLSHILTITVINSQYIFYVSDFILGKRDEHIQTFLYNLQSFLELTKARISQLESYGFSKLLLPGAAQQHHMIFHPPYISFARALRISIMQVLITLVAFQATNLRMIPITSLR